MRYDLVPRFSTAAVGEMQKELLGIDYKGLLHDDLMEHEVRGRQAHKVRGLGCNTPDCLVGYLCTKGQEYGEFLAAIWLWQL